MLVCCSAISVASSAPAPASSRNDAGDLRHREQPEPLIGARRDADAAVRQPEAVRRVGGRQARHERQQDRRRERQADADPQQRGIHREIQRPHRESRGVAREHGDHRPRDQHAQQRTGAAQHQAFGQQRPAQRAGGRTQRGANRQLAFTAHRARQNQVGDVRARNDEDQSRRREQHEQHGAGRRRDLIAQLDRGDPEVVFHRVRLAVLGDDRAVRGLQLGARLLEVRTRREPAEQLRHAMDAAVLHRRGHVMRARHHVGDQLGFGGVGHRRLEHADDRRRAIAQLDLLAEHAVVAVERRAPEAVRQHRDARLVRAVIGGVDQAAANRLQPHHAEERAADHAGANHARLAEADQREIERSRSRRTRRSSSRATSSR